jgi:hypothetical protein
MIVSLLKTVLLFGLVGPLIGLCCVILQDTAGFTVVLPSILLLLSFVFGVVPAVVTGLVAWALRYRLPRYLGGIMCGVVGAVASVLFWTVLPQSALPIESLARLGAVPGGIAGFICGLAYFWPPNNSFKPKPLRGSA